MIEDHYLTFITERDFEWLARQGVEAVRLPIGYWLFGTEPYHSSIKYVDFAFDMAAKYNLKIVLDLHAAPGSQNAYDHSGRAGTVEWHKKRDTIVCSLKTVEKLATRYANQPAFFGFELLNEPAWEIPFGTLQDYYRRGYEIVRLCAGPSVKVIFSDGYRNFSWIDLFRSPRYINVAQDIHMYQVFETKYKSMSFAEILNCASVDWTRRIRQLQQYNDIMVGEWSLALPAGISGLPPNRTVALQMYSKAQLTAFKQARAGWFFWTYKTEAGPAWSFRDAVIRDWLKV